LENRLRATLDRVDVEFEFAEGFATTVRETVAAALFGKQNQRLIDERSPGIPADCQRDHLTGLTIPYLLETWLRVPRNAPRHLSTCPSTPLPRTLAIWFRLRGYGW